MKKIVVTGDICINTLLWSASPGSAAVYNWQSHNSVRTLTKPGEALLLAEMVSLSTKEPVATPSIPVDISYAERFLRSFAELEAYPDNMDSKKYRVSRFLGFSASTSGTPALLPIMEDTIDASIIVIDDENNGFNNTPSYWPQAIVEPDTKPVVLYKMNNPIGANALWRHLEKHHVDETIVIINADDLRSKGVNISKGLSWEKTALDFVWQLGNNPNLTFLTGSRHLIVPFGLEGVIYCKNEEGVESTLYFLPYEFEGDITQTRFGRMFGLTSCFTAALAGAITRNVDKQAISDVLPKGIRLGMLAARRYYLDGFGSNPAESIFPDPQLFDLNSGDMTILEDIQDVRIHKIKSQKCQKCWFILKEKSTANLAEIAFSIVKYGEDRSLRAIPTAKFGRLKTIDRTEIESYRSIRNLVTEYLAAKEVMRPLSIAVFGTPGSGKSFGVSEVASSIAPEMIKKLSYNLSQFSSVSELTRAFHKIRDFSLEGIIPLVVFDEFDASYDGKLGWLKYFLAPMQDGIFRDQEATHPIGRAIFVFAGGTSSTFSEFTGECISDEQEIRSFESEFSSAKGPDFVSRLRGYVNILGPNQANESDHLYIVRRAMMLRALVERKLQHIINENGEALIDNGVLRAMLKVPRYKHEARSMEAIIEMSMLSGAKRWEQSLLPSREQLMLHVDEEQFLSLMMRDAIFSERIDFMTDILASKLQQRLDDSDITDNVAVRPVWPDLKELCKDQIRHIPDALLQIQYDVISAGEKSAEVLLADQELEQLAQFELKRQSNRRIKTDASEAFEELIHRMIKLWPEVLTKAGYRIERFTFVDLCECSKNK
jgi:hypothetical protein